MSGSGGNGPSPTGHTASALPSLPGGSASKVADLYELTWTVASLLDLLDGTIQELHLEPRTEDGLGVEFYCVLPSGAREYHSVKRQAPGSASAWTPYELARTTPTPGRSVLGDLFRHLARDDGARVVLVSQDSAGAMRELAERARAAPSPEGFDRFLSEQLRASFDKYIAPLAPDAGAAHRMLRRCQFATVSHHMLVRSVEDRIPALIQRNDGTAANAADVRHLLGEFAWSRLPQIVSARDVLDALRERGFAEQPLAASAQVRGRIADHNEAYRGRLGRTLINGAHIPRVQARAIVEELTSGSQSLLLAGTAGIGKSCIVAQVLEQLDEAEIAHLVLSLDALDGVVSSTDLAQRMGLPASPAIVLGKMSAGGRAVLCIDQLDALSFVAGQNVQGVQVLEELLQQASRYPHLRVFLACRSFDLEHDSLLRGLVGGDPPAARRIDVEALSVEDVSATLAAADAGDPYLAESQVELLRIPLHLQLFLGGGTAREGFGSRRDLFDRYWDEKRRKVDAVTTPGAFVAAAERLSGVLSDRRQLQVPRTPLTGHEAALDAMASEHVVVVDGSRASFFHASFFDYAFARCFVGRGEVLVDWLKSDGQDLFRRSQMRQVLEFLRGDDPEGYLGTLSRLLSDEAIRFHLKRLTLDWLGQLADPREEEWQLLNGQDDPLHGHVTGSIRNRAPWFDLLDRLGVLRVWLTSEHEEDRARAIYILQMPDVLEGRSARVAGLLQTLVGGSEADKEHLLSVMSRGSAHHSREMIDLFLGLIDDGTLDDTRGFGLNGDWWLVLYQMSTARPDYCSEAIGCWFDRQHMLADHDEARGFDDVSRWSQSSEHVIGSAASGAPLAFAREILPRVAHVAAGSDGKMWAYPVGLTSGEIVEGLLGALANLAAADPSSLDDLFESLTASPPLIVDRLKLVAWAANADRYSDQILRLLNTRPDLLSAPDIGRAVREGTRLGSLELCAEFEQIVLRHAPKQERGRSSGYSQFRLLSDIAPEALSASGIRRLAELRRKFGDERPPVEATVPQVTWGAVPPRIPNEATALMTDEHWLRAMRTVQLPRVSGPGVSEWDEVTLSRQLETRAQIEPERFARFATDQMADDLPQRYFSAILAGLTSAERGDLPLEELIQVIRRVHELPDRPCGQEVGRAVTAIANERVPPDVMEAVAFYATEDPDPSGDAWLTRPPSERYRQDVVTAGINSVRGVAAEAIAALLFADPGRIAPMRNAVAALVRDPTLTVRALAARSLLAILRDDERGSLELFAALCNNADPILGTRYVEQYLHYAIYRSYEAVRPILLRMLESSDVDTRGAAARQVCLAALHDDESRGAATEDASRVENGDAGMRAGAATIYAQNCGRPDVAQNCVVKLPRFFDDPATEVRTEAVSCFRHLEDDPALARDALIAAFSESAALADGARGILSLLEEMSGPLPASICSLAERAVATWGVAAGDISTSRAADAMLLSKLVIRFYAQASDDAQRERALAAIDRMIELGFLGIQAELATADRA